MYDKKYFLGFSDHWVGPYTINELRSLPLSKTNKIWTVGLEEWSDIENVEELRGLIKLIPPPLTSYDEKQRREDYKIDYVVRGLEDVGGKYERLSLLFQVFAAIFMIIALVAAGVYLIYFVKDLTGTVFLAVSIVCLIMSLMAMRFSKKGQMRYEKYMLLAEDVVMINGVASDEVSKKINDFC